ncbi:Fe2+-enterobactin ABC transporter substrate-binding protein [Kineococcus sp. G2]|uniref:Fe2+-enterobactin ABC transporter substrate-binding protein n=1 Tax=Kineococcus sp. G2 TaxID=3127484 RepID=UPI00301E1C5A
MRPTTTAHPRTSRRAVLAGASGLALLALTACSGGSGQAAEQTPAATTSSAPALRTVTTEQGAVEVPGDPQRIAVLSGGLAGYLFALDAPVVATDTRVLGVTDLQGGFPPAWADEATEQGTTALPAGEQLNIEAVAAANPDLIIGGGQGITAVQAQEAYEQLSDIAPTVLVPTSTTSWQEQLELVAEATGRTDGVDELVAAYDERVEEVRSSITVPDGNAVFLLSLPVGKPFLIPADAALPALAEEVGFTPDDVLTKAGNPTLYGSGDSFEVSPELLGQVADAPVAFVVDLGGASVEELAQDPVYAALPAFRNGQVHELPATSYRPDYDGAMDALDAIAEEFGA